MNNILIKVFFILSLFVSCVQKGHDPILRSLGRTKNSVTRVNSLSVSNNQLIIKGSGLSKIKSVTLKNSPLVLNESFSIESISDSQIIANGLKNLSFATNTLFDLILSSSVASSTYSVQFDLCDSILGGKGFNCLLTPNDKDVLSYDAALGKWSSRSITGLNYLGVLNLPTLPTAPNGVGDYYIIGAAGIYTGTNYSVGDWIVLSSDGITWEKVGNAMGVTSVFGRAGIVAAKKGDYVLNKMGDVDLTTIAPVSGNVLQFNGTNWVPGAGGGGGSVASLTATAPLSVTGTTAPVISLSQANGTTNGYLTGGDWTAFNNKAGTVSPTFTGSPIAPTAAANTSTTQIATTAFVLGQVGSSNIGTVGTITSGVWNGTAIDIAYGGTGATTLGAAQSALGIKIAGTTAGTVPLLGGSGIIANNICVGDTLGGSLSCATANTSSGLLGLISDETGTGPLVFGTSPTITDPVISNIAPAANFTLTQNTVAPFTSEWASAVANTLYLKAGKVGIGTNTPSASLDVKGTIKLSGTTSGYVGFTSPAVGGAETYTLPITPGSNGQVLTTNGAASTPTLSWTTPAGGGGGITSLGTLTAAIQTFANGTAGLTPAFNSSGSIHTLNIPMAATASVTAGLLSKADYDIFNAKQAAFTDSASVSTVISDEIGTGLLVFNTSPTFTGVPLAPTAAVSISTTQIATTQFVLNQGATVAPLMDGSSAIGTSGLYARQDHVHASDTSRQTTLTNSAGLAGAPPNVRIHVAST